MIQINDPRFAAMKKQALINAEKEKFSEKQITDAVRNLLIATLYPELKTNPDDIQNDIHPQRLLKTIYNADPTKYLKQITSQQFTTKNIRTASDVKRWLTMASLFFTYDLIQQHRTPEQNKALLEVENEKIGQDIHKGNLEFIEIIGNLARKTCKTKSEKIEFFRTYLADLGVYK